MVHTVTDADLAANALGGCGERKGWRCSGGVSRECPKKGCQRRKNGWKALVPRAGLEPAHLAAGDFESRKTMFGDDA